jgi:hypothetical protein
VDCKLVAYRRVSTQKQGRSGLGLEAQDAAIRTYAAQAGCTVVREFTEVETGKRADRPELAKAINCAKRNNAVLVIAKLDRISRKVYFSSGLMESGVDFFAADCPNDDVAMTHFRAVIAEDEARKISQPGRPCRSSDCSTEGPSRYSERTGRNQPRRLKIDGVFHAWRGPCPSTRPYVMHASGNPTSWAKSGPTGSG